MAVHEDNFKVEIEKKTGYQFPANQEYVVTDPCYLFDNDSQLAEYLWIEVVSAIHFPSSAKKSGVITITKEDDGNSVSFFFGASAHGDGIYQVKGPQDLSGEILVDAGLICVISYSEAKTLVNWTSDSYEEMLSNITRPESGVVSSKLKEPLHIAYDGEGNFKSDNLYIDTEGEMMECEQCGQEFHEDEGYYGTFCSLDCVEESEEQEQEEDEEW